MNRSWTGTITRTTAARMTVATALVVGGLAVSAPGALRADDGPVTIETNDPAAEAEATPVGFDISTLLTTMSWYAAPFGLASVIALWYSIERLVVLRRGRVIPKSFVDRFFDLLRGGRLDAAEALRICDENGSPVATVFAHGIRKWGKPSVEVEQAIIDGGERQVAQLRSNLRVINGVATVTPLLGLLGTVIGMIQAFNQIAVDSDAMGRAGQLAGGIAVALLTTAAGLSIAIPALIMYMYLAGRVDALVMEMDHLAQNLVHLISAESLGSRAARRPVDPAPEPTAAPTKKKTVKKRAV